MLQQNQDQWLQSNPIFQNIGRASRADLLNQAKIQHFPKGQSLFTHGHPAQNFQVVLKGRIKIFKDNADGDNTIIDFAGPGQALTICAIFSDSILPFNAEAIEDAEIVSIPARLLRSLAQSDHALSKNLLSAMAEQAQIYLRQLDQLNLKSVPQRVGNFVLRQFLGNAERNKIITLPYDKSLIAAYLGMQPESFSRALNHLRKEGIDIDKDSIALPHLFALCGYCDVDTAQKCSWHGTAECPNPQC